MTIGTGEASIMRVVADQAAGQDEIGPTTVPAQSNASTRSAIWDLGPVLPPDRGKILSFMKRLLTAWREVRAGFA
jgi:hypothetical protein